MNNQQPQTQQQGQPLFPEIKIHNTKGLHTSKVKILIYGESGNGKTTLAGTLPEENTLIISAESGLLCIDDKNFDVIEVKTWNEVRGVYANITRNPAFEKYEYIVLDSLTELSGMLVTHLEGMTEYKPANMALKMWGEYAKQMTQMIKLYRDIDRTVVFTALVEDVLDDGAVVKKPLIKGSAVTKMLPSYFDELFYLSIETTSEGKRRVVNTDGTTSFLAKDRSGKLAEQENANLTEIINKIKGN